MLHLRNPGESFSDMRVNRIIAFHCISKDDKACQRPSKKPRTPGLASLRPSKPHSPGRWSSNFTLAHLHGTVTEHLHIGGKSEEHGDHLRLDIWLRRAMLPAQGYQLPSVGHRRVALVRRKLHRQSPCTASFSCQMLLTVGRQHERGPYVFEIISSMFSHSPVVSWCS